MYVYEVYMYVVSTRAHTRSVILFITEIGRLTCARCISSLQMGFGTKFASNESYTVLCIISVFFPLMLKVYFAHLP